LTVEKGMHNLLIRKAISPEWDSDFTNKLQCDYPLPYLHALAKSKRMIPIYPENDENPKIRYFYAEYDFGCIFLFENASDSLTLDEYITFTSLENLKFLDSDYKENKGQPYLLFIVPPQTRVRKILRKIDLNENLSIDFKLNSRIINESEQKPSLIQERMNPLTISDIELIAFLKNKGKVVPVTIKSVDDCQGMTYYYRQYGVFYAFYFENLNEKYTLDLKLTFELENYRLDESDEIDKNVWKIRLSPGENKLKKIFKIEEKKNGQFILSKIAKIE
jgi:hypothetical protein